MISIQLNCGVSVTVEALSLKRTYSGILEGKPHEIINRRIFQNADYPSEWGKRKVLKLSPSEEDFHAELKPFMFSVWLDSLGFVDSKYDGADLVVIWFEDAPNDKSLESCIADAVADLDWNKHAKGYEF